MFQPIDEGDLRAIVDLMNRAYRGTGSWNSEAGIIAGERASLDLLRAQISETPTGCFLKWLDPGGSICGCVWLEPLAGDIWYLGSLAADPDQQNAGLGRQLLAGAEQWAAAHGARRIRMSVVNVRDTLIAWYVRRGYHLTGETEPFPYDDRRFGTPLRDDLHFVILERALGSVA
jgi:ribosomal protein S18 acetylase RimI-like enzyme